MMTTAAARYILPWCLKQADTHQGTFFHSTLQKKLRQTMGACALLPPIGDAVYHPSTTTIGRLETPEFGFRYSQEGTRPLRPGDAQRSIIVLAGTKKALVGRSSL